MKVLREVQEAFCGGGLKIHGGIESMGPGRVAVVWDISGAGFCRSTWRAELFGKAQLGRG
jgi:hypothetical protein